MNPEQISVTDAMVAKAEGDAVVVVGIKILAIGWHWRRPLSSSVLIEDSFGNQQWMGVNDAYRLTIDLKIGLTNA